MHPQCLEHYLSEFDFISKDSKRIPSPLNVSAIPCKDARVNNFV